MKGSAETKQLATDIYNTIKSQLHVTVQQYVKKILEGS